MKKAKSTKGDIRSEYKRSDFTSLERGKYTDRVRAHSNVVVLDPEVSAAFPDSAAVNDALRALARIAKRVGTKR